MALRSSGSLAIDGEGTIGEIAWLVSPSVKSSSSKSWGNGCLDVDQVDLGGTLVGGSPDVPLARDMGISGRGLR